MIYKYKVFENSVEFEEWQVKNSVNMITLSPIIQGVGGTAFNPENEDEIAGFGAGFDVALFVVYSENKGDN